MMTIANQENTKLRAVNTALISTLRTAQKEGKEATAAASAAEGKALKVTKEANAAALAAVAAEEKSLKVANDGAALKDVNVKLVGELRDARQSSREVKPITSLPRTPR